MKYHKIQSVFKRDPDTKFKTFLPDYSLPAFDALSNINWVWTEKIDGMNMRAIWDGVRQRFAGRSDNANIHPDLMTHMERSFPHNLMLHTFGNSEVVIYGEGYGPGIQKNGGAYRDDKGFIAFDVNINGKWLSRAEAELIAGVFGVPFVPTILVGTIEEGINRVMGGFASVVASSDRNAEGLVGRPPVELFDGYGNRMICKLKEKDYANKESKGDA